MAAIEVSYSPEPSKVVEIEVPGSTTIVEVGSLTRVEYSLVTDLFVADTTTLTQKQVSLSKEPLEPEKVELVVFGGVEQRANVDFYIDGQILTWNQLALEHLLEVGTAFSVRYTSR